MRSFTNSHFAEYGLLIDQPTAAIVRMQVATIDTLAALADVSGQCN